MKCKYLALVIALAMILSLASACSGTGAAPASTAPATSESSAPAESPADTSGELKLDTYTRLTMGSASIGGALYNWGATIAPILGEHIKNLEITNEATNGPAANLGIVSTHQSDIGVITDSVAYQGFHGIGQFENEDYSNVRTMFVSYPSAVQVFTIPGTGITSVADLEGKSIGFGPAGSSGDIIGHDVLKSLGITPGKETYLSWSDTINNLKDGLIDACVDCGGFPHSSRQELEATHDIVWLTFTDDQINTVHDAFPYYLSGYIPKDTYKDLTEDYHTWMVWYDVCCADDMDPDLVYKIVKAAYESQDDLTQVSSLGQFLYPENISNSTIPLHVGAIRYFEEMGIELNDAQYPPEYTK